MTVAILLINPKYPRNVGAVLRTCAAYGVPKLVWTGRRIEGDLHERLPREERMRGFRDVYWGPTRAPFDELPALVPVAIEVMANSESLVGFEHPPNALYVFGPEDGGLTGVTLRHCHRFVSIPTLHCLNLAMAVGTVLYDRQVKLNPEARLDMSATEGRGRGRSDEELWA